MLKSKITGDSYKPKLVDGAPKKLGEGSFGVVMSATNEQNGETVAIKCSKNTITDKEKNTMLSIPRHENIVQLLDHFCSETTDALWVVTKTHYLVMEVATGDLEYFVKNVISPENKEKGSPQGKENLQKYMNMLISGVKHLHLHKILHRDLKPANVLTFEDDDDKYKSGL